jgi:hypothetical protein
MQISHTWTLYSPNNQVISISLLFLTFLGIQKRFYENVGLKIAKKLRDLGSSKNSRYATLKRGGLKEAAVSTKDKQFVELFSLKEENELLIQGKKILRKF